MRAGRPGRWSALCRSGGTLAVAAGAALAVPDTARALQHDSHVRAVHAQPESAPAVTRILEHEGVRVALSLTPVTSDATAAPLLREGTDMLVRVALTDLASGEAVENAALAAWVDRRSTDSSTAPAACREKVESYMQGSLRVRPVIDLNAYFLLALNAGNTISVIDPFIGFGNTKLYTTVRLPGEGEDWASAADGARLFVTMPRLNQLAVVRTDTWKVERSLEVGLRPKRVARGPGAGRVWVATHGVRGDGGGITVIDPVTLERVGRIETGSAGAHDLAFSSDGRFAFVTNEGAGTVTVIDTRSLTAVATVRTGESPTAVAYSPVGRAAYVVDGSEGTIVAVDGATHEIRMRASGAPGLATMRFDLSGRWGFVPNSATDQVYVLDAATDSVVHALAVGPTPIEVSFTPGFAYVRSMGTTDVAMIPLSALDAGTASEIWPFPAGALLPEDFGDRATAPAITRAPQFHDGVYVANPGEKVIYVYHHMEGMPTPSGTLNNYGFTPRAIRTLGKSIRETAPGVFTTTTLAPDAGRYDVVLVVDDPRVLHCFEFEVEPGLAAEPGPTRVAVRAVGETTLPAGEPAVFRFELRYAGRDTAPPPVEDLLVRVYAPTGWQGRAPAVPREDGTYAVTLTTPVEGPYYLVVSSQTLGVRVQDQYPVTLVAKREM